MAVPIHGQGSSHEATDADIRPIVWTGVGLAGVTLLLAMVVYFMFRSLDRPAIVYPNPMAQSESQLPPRPRLENHSGEELPELRSYEDHQLSTYGWADQNERRVRIPIERAMELQLQRGFPVRKGSQ
jgi:hypothetical protein